MTIDIRNEHLQKDLENFKFVFQGNSPETLERRRPLGSVTMGTTQVRASVRRCVYSPRENPFS